MHPGLRLAQDFLAPLGIHASELAHGLGVHRSTVSRLLAGKQPITPGMAARLGAYLQVPPRWFLMMQAEYDAEQVVGLPEPAGVTPLDIGDEWLLTPEGAMSLESRPPPAPAASRSTVVRQVPLENGSILLTNGPQ